jgi:hypothetical protein
MTIGYLLILSVTINILLILLGTKSPFSEKVRGFFYAASIYSLAITSTLFVVYYQVLLQNNY